MNPYESPAGIELHEWHMPEWLKKFLKTTAICIGVILLANIVYVWMLTSNNAYKNQPLVEILTDMASQAFGGERKL